MVEPEPPLVALPPQPDGLAWPTTEWERGGAPVGLDLEGLVDEMFADARYETSYAVLVVHHGRLIAERYANALPNWVGDDIAVDRTTPLLSWSMAKSMLHAIVGVLVGEGRLRLDETGLVPEWRDDERAAIGLRDLLAMRDGLDWNEDYVDAGGSQVIDMLYGEGNADVGAFARSRPLAVPPGTRFNYSSGTTNVISGIVADVVGRGDAYRKFLHDRLFVPIGMTTAEPTLDPAGLWVASSYVHAIAEDFARFGYLYLRDGVWDGARVLPEGWVDSGRQLHSIDPENGHGYGWQWWVTHDEHGTFWANGYEGQSILVSPGQDLVVVRIGRTDAAHSDDLFEWRARVVDAFATAAR
jgi:CubicO group peptidase (beta-lactamase class C family)